MCCLLLKVFNLTAYFLAWYLLFISLSLINAHIHISSIHNNHIHLCNLFHLCNLCHLCNLFRLCNLCHLCSLFHSCRNIRLHSNHFRNNHHHSSQHPCPW